MCTIRTCKFGLTTAFLSDPGPILHVPTGWKMEVAILPAASASSASDWSSEPESEKRGRGRQKARDEGGGEGPIHSTPRDIKTSGLKNG